MYRLPRDHGLLAVMRDNTSHYPENKRTAKYANIDYGDSELLKNKKK